MCGCGAKGTTGDPARPPPAAAARATRRDAQGDGRRSQRVECLHYFNVIWDEAEELQRLAEMSDPRITIDTAGMAPEATELANQLARAIGRLSPEDLSFIRNEVVKRTR